MVCELFGTLTDIFDIHTVFDKISMDLEDLIEKIQQASKAYDEVTDCESYMKERPDNITLLTPFQFKRFKTILRAWEELDDTVFDAVKKAQSICRRRWYTVDHIMTDLSFATMELIEKACPPGLMIEQVEKRRDEQEDKIKELDHINIHDVEQLIKQPFIVQSKIYVYIQIWHKLAKNEVEDYKCNAQLGIESATYLDIKELLRIQRVWKYFLGY